MLLSILCNNCSVKFCVKRKSTNKCNLQINLIDLKKQNTDFPQSAKHKGIKQNRVLD